MWWKNNVPKKCEWPGCALTIEKEGAILIQDGKKVGLCIDHTGLIFATIVSGGMDAFAAEFTG